MIRLFHKSSSNDALLGTVEITVRDWLPQDHNTHCTLNLQRKFAYFDLHSAAAREYKLHRAGLNIGKSGLIVVSLCPKSEEHSSIVQEGAVTSTSSDRPGAEALAELERAEATTTKLTSYRGTIVDSITTASSSDVCSSVLGCVEQLIRLGDVISQVILHLVYYSVGNIMSICRSIHMPSSHGRC
jgi:hypothetical protein